MKIIQLDSKNGNKYSFPFCKDTSGEKMELVCMLPKSNSKSELSQASN